MIMVLIRTSREGGSLGGDEEVTDGDESRTEDRG
jgi:hypothetical protein